jgi:hypothetical protein
MSTEDLSEIKVDVGVLKTQVLTLSSLCNKMDTVIDKLMDQHDRHITKVYVDMDARRVETDKDIKEINQRIDTMLDKIQNSEIRIMEKIDDLRVEMQEHNKKEKESLDKLLQWKWMVAGGIIVVSWLIANINFDTISALVK